MLKHLHGTYLCVLLDQFGEVREQAVLWPEEVKLVIPLFSVHQVGQKLPTITGNKLCCQLDDITVTQRQTVLEMAQLWLVLGSTVKASPSPYSHDQSQTTQSRLAHVQSQTIQSRLALVHTVMANPCQSSQGQAQSIQSWLVLIHTATASPSPYNHGQIWCLWSWLRLVYVVTASPSLHSHDQSQLDQIYTVTATELLSLKS